MLLQLRLMSLYFRLIPLLFRFIEIRLFRILLLHFHLMTLLFQLISSIFQLMFSLFQLMSLRFRLMSSIFRLMSSKFQLMLFLTHGYSVGVAVSDSRDFLICIKFCVTMAIVLDPPVCFARLVCILSDSIHIVYQFTETCSPFVLPFKQSWAQYFESFRI